jgi:SHS family lactate transporter-like MFS transporter
MEKAPARLRGVLSGLLQEGYATGYLLAAVCYFVVFPRFGWRPMFFIGGLPALLAVFVRFRVKESEVWERTRHRDWANLGRAIVGNWKLFLYLTILMAMMNFVSHGTQDMYPTLLGTSGYSKARIADLTMISMVGAVLGGLVFGYYSDRSGRRRAMISAASCGLLVLPFWIAGFSPLVTVVGVFMMQFFVQGAWGVIPAHINELSPGHLRGFMPGVAYQLGILCASSIPYIESTLGERFTYTQAMGGLMAVVFVGGFIVTLLGPEAHGVSFRKSTVDSRQSTAS